MLVLLATVALTPELPFRTEAILARAVQPRRHPAPPPEPSPAMARQSGVDGSDGEAQAARALGLAEIGDPPIQEVVAAAVAHAGIDDGALESWGWRSRLAPLLPKLSAEYRHDERSYRAVGLQGGSEVDYLRSTPGDTVAVRASWSVDELVFSPSELKAAALAAQLRRRRDEIIERVTRLYYERRRLRVGLALSPSVSPAERAEREIEIEAATARLDALTGGLFAGNGS